MTAVSDSGDKSVLISSNVEYHAIINETCGGKSPLNIGKILPIRVLVADDRVPRFERRFRIGMSRPLPESLQKRLGDYTHLSPPTEYRRRKHDCLSIVRRL